MAEPEHGDLRPSVPDREVLDQLLHLQQVGLEWTPGRRPARVLLAQEGRVARLGAVHGDAGLDHHPLHGRGLARAGGQHVHGPDHVRLVQRPGTEGAVHRDRAVHDGVQLQLAHELVDDRVAGVRVHELGPAERHPGVGHVQPEDGLDVLALFEPARQLPAQELGDARD